MSDGDDCTYMLTNADFSQSGGWTSAVGPEWPAEGNNVGQAINMVFDVYQELTGLQNGLYEFATHDIYRAAEPGSVTGDEDFKAYIYINTFKKRMNGLRSDGSETSLGGDTRLSDGSFVPVNATGAANYFAADKYAQSVYGLVTDGTLRLGYRNDLRYGDGSRAWWGGARLIFRGKNADALRDAIAVSVSDANELFEQSFGQPEVDALRQAINDANDAETADLYDALVVLKQTMAHADTSIAAYSAIVASLRQLEDVL